MARQDQKTSDRHREATRPDPRSGDWYSGERGNEFGGEAKEIRDVRQSSDTGAWPGERRQQFMDKFERWRSERAARAANRGPDSASDGTSRRETGRSAKK